MTPEVAGVSFVVPVRNGARSIGATLDSIFAQRDACPLEVIVIDDRSTDRSLEVLREYGVRRPVRIIDGEGRGAAAAINVGIHASRFPIVCQIDQDVVLQGRWLTAILSEFSEPSVAASQGYYATDRTARVCARVMSLDLEQRYAAIAGREIDHVCTGNAAYRVEALRAIGMFDESLGYGYDNDVSYRLRAAGYRLTFCRPARSLHEWRDNLSGYVVQQYGFGYGRLDLVAKHPNRFGGDAVSPAGMMLHPAVMALGAALIPVSVSASGICIAALGGERLIAGMRAVRRFRQWTPLLFPVLHLVRDAAWVAAFFMWAMRRLRGLPSKPSHSMLPRPRVQPSPNLPPT